MARCYFDRPSAAKLSEEEADERERIMEDALALKKAATDYLHPEAPVVTTDASACGRNYFSRASAPHDEDGERARILEDALALKKAAAHYLHPEAPVITTDATAFGRDYFSRASAPVNNSA